MRIAVPAILLVMFLTAAGCGKEPPNLISDQQDEIVRQLGNTEYALRDGVYVVTLNADRDDYETAAVIRPGGTVKYYYAAFRFRDRQDSIPLFTNRVAWVPRTQLTAGWRAEIERMESPKTVTLGSTPVIAGVERGLPGCRVGDVVAMYLTSDLAFGGTPVGTVEKNTPLIYVLEITSE